MSNNILRIPYFATRGLFGGQKSQWITMSFKRYFETGEGHLDFVPRRALMYIPGSDQRKLQKIPNLGCDCAVMDMEDGVAQTRKVEARQNIVKALSEVDFSNVSDVAVRINSVSSGLAEDDLVALAEAEKPPMTLMLPKVDTCEEALWFASTMKTVYKKCNLLRPLRLVIFTESAEGLLDLKPIIRRLIKLSCSTDKQGAAYVLEGVVFGSDDYCASIGATRTADGRGLQYARQKVVVTAKAYQLQAIDKVYIDYKDHEGLKTDAQEGACMGFTGKQVIHPGQVKIVQEAFTPSQDHQQWAKELMREFDEHQQSGKGAFVFRDKMIDMPLLRQAQNIVRLCEKMKMPA